MWKAFGAFKLWRLGKIRPLDSQNEKLLQEVEKRAAVGDSTIRQLSLFSYFLQIDTLAVFTAEKR